jgi:hypothetical protein
VARITGRRVAEVAISVLFLALLRALSEYYRLEYTRGSALTLAEVAPFITGALMAALGLWAAVIAYFVERYRLAIGIVGAVISAMLIYKVVVIGPLP